VYCIKFVMYDFRSLFETCCSFSWLYENSYCRSICLKYYMLRGNYVNGDRLEIGKWQNSTPHRFKTPNRLPKKLAWMIRSARGHDVPNLVGLVYGGLLGRCAFFGTIILFFTYYTYIHIPFFLRPTYRSDPWTDFDSQYTKTRGIMQGSNLWGLK